MKKVILQICILCFFCCGNEEEKMNEIPITIEAIYMQYACGLDNDDMMVNLVRDTAFNFLVGKDIDPLFLDGKEVVNDFFHENKTEKFGMEYRMKGFISSCALNGCDKGSPKFWITNIERMNGEKFNK